MSNSPSRKTLRKNVSGHVDITHSAWIFLFVIGPRFLAPMYQPPTRFGPHHLLRRRGSSMAVSVFILFGNFIYIKYIGQES